MQIYFFIGMPSVMIDARSRRTHRTVIPRPDNPNYTSVVSTSPAPSRF